MSIMRLATKAIISLRRSSSEPFSTSAFRVILSIVMVRSLDCVWSFATRANLDSDHDGSPAGAAVDDLGKRLHGASLSGRPPAALRATPPPRLLPHARGRQLYRPRSGAQDTSGFSSTRPTVSRFSKATPTGFIRIILGSGRKSAAPPLR